jgi:hypothetical protein
MKISHAKDKKADLDAYSKLVYHLDSKQKVNLNLILNLYDHLFDGLLEDWKTESEDLQLTEVR